MSKHASDCIPLADVCTGMGWSRLNFLAGLWIGQHLLKVEVEVVDKKNSNALHVLVWTFAVHVKSTARQQGQECGDMEKSGVPFVSRLLECWWSRHALGACRFALVEHCSYQNSTQSTGVELSL